VSEGVGGALDTSQFAVARFRHVLSALLRMSCHCQFVAHCKRSHLLQHDIGKKTLLLDPSLTSMSHAKMVATMVLKWSSGADCLAFRVSPKMQNNLNTLLPA
jgi:hypothetical protein